MQAQVPLLTGLALEVCLTTEVPESAENEPNIDLWA
jgi:hypothetical protein